MLDLVLIQSVLKVMFICSQKIFKGEEVTQGSVEAVYTTFDIQDSLDGRRKASVKIVDAVCATHVPNLLLRLL